MKCRKWAILDVNLLLYPTGNKSFSVNRYSLCYSFRFDQFPYWVLKNPVTKLSGLRIPGRCWQSPLVTARR